MMPEPISPIKKQVVVYGEHLLNRNQASKVASLNVNKKCIPNIFHMDIGMLEFDRKTVSGMTNL